VTGEIARAIGDVLTEHLFDTTVIPPEASRVPSITTCPDM